ncbi:MAG: hypothetical protein ABTD50_04555 [Polyangiaceae bacterium]
MKAPTKIFDDAESESSIDEGSASRPAACPASGAPQVPPERAGVSDVARECCADCGLEAPATQTAYTLISPAHRWRLEKGVDASGRQVVKWRCAKCWARYRAKTAPIP